MKITKQMEFTTHLIKEFRRINQNNEFPHGIPVHSRGFHYFIVTRTGDLRMIPGNSTKGNPSIWSDFWNCKVRLYENNKSNYSNIDRVLVDCRIAGLIPHEWIIDLKSHPLGLSPDETELLENFEPEFSDLGYFSNMFNQKMPEFKDIKEEFEYGLEIESPQFKHQLYHIVIVIEKASYGNIIESVAKKHGADFIRFAGQPTLTRNSEVCKRAKAKGKPILFLYCSDCDPGGWFMPSALMKRTQEIYHNPLNKLVRVFLTREQIEEYDLPSSFEIKDKNYPEKVKQRFILETGSNICVELDALSPLQIEEILEKAIEQYSGITEDKEEYDEVVEKWENIKERMDETFDVSNFEDEYNEVKKLHDNLFDRIEEFKKEIEEEKEDIYEQKEEIKRNMIEQITEQLEDIKEELK